jgi:hypothetical protein
MRRDRDYVVTIAGFRRQVDRTIGAMRRLTIGQQLPLRGVSAHYRAATGVALVRLTVEAAAWGKPQDAALRAWAEWEHLPLLDTRRLCPSEWLTFYQHYLPSFERSVVHCPRPEAALHALAFELAHGSGDDNTQVDLRPPSFG